MRAARLLAAGVLSGAVSGTPSAAAWAVGHAEPLSATREIGRRFLGRPSLLAGAAVHLTLSAAFALPAGPLLAARPGARVGALYGAALYALNFGLVAPRAWPQVRRFSGPLQLADHLVYGAALGWMTSPRHHFCLT